MPSKNKAGACGCCVSCDPTTITEEFSLAYDTTFTMAGVTYYAWNLPTLTGDQTVYAAWDDSGSTSSYYVFQLTGGDWYRVYTPWFFSGGAAIIEKSTDSGVSWTKALDFTNCSTTEIDYYKNEEDPSGTPYIALTDFVGEQLEKKNAVVFGHNGLDCYFGLSVTQMVKLGPSDPTWFQPAQEIWNVAGGKATLDEEFLIALTSESIANAYFAKTSTGNVNGKWVRLGSYNGYDCTSESDPNCDTVCPVAFPSIALDISEATFTLTHGTVGKATTIESDFDANAGYDYLQDGEIRDADPFVVQNEISDFLGSSKTEWFTNDYKTKYRLENWAHEYSTGLCKFQGQFDQFPWWDMPGGYFYRIGFGDYDALGVRQWLNEYEWTLYSDPFGGAPGNIGVSALTSTIATAYDGDIANDVSQERISFELEVVGETDCTVTLQLTMTDESLYHGDSSIINSGATEFETTPVRTLPGGVPLWTFTHGANWKFPYSARDVDQSIYYKEVGAIATTSGGSPGTYGPHLAYHLTSAFASGVEVTFAQSISETTPADPSWLPWIVTWQKTIDKADLPTTTVVNFSGSDVTSTNRGAGRITLVPPDYSQPAQHAYSDTYLAPSGTIGGAWNCISWRPYGYTKSTATIADSDWSASVTLDIAPFH